MLLKSDLGIVMGALKFFEKCFDKQILFFKKSHFTLMIYIDLFFPLYFFRNFAKEKSGKKCVRN